MGIVDALQQDVLARLDAAGLPDEVHGLVYATLLGELDAWLSGKTPTKPPPANSVAPDPVGAYIESISVQGFRGIGAATRLRLTPGPGLTLVVGRNGSGKSSFAEALEVLLTGDNQRWSSGRTKIWREGWRNLHHGTTTKVKVGAQLLIEGRAGMYEASRVWLPNAQLDDNEATVSHDAKVEPLAALGWSQGLATYRPFLSYNELSSVLEDGQAKLFDALGSILGLEDLVFAADELKRVRAERSVAHKAVADELKALRAVLEESSDPRAAQCVAACKGNRWKLQELSAFVDGGAQASGDEVRVLQQIVGLQKPDLAQVEAAASAYRAALTALHQLAGTDAARARLRADIIDKSLALHEQHGDGDCPVCRSPQRLTEQWRAQAIAEAKALRQEASSADQAHARVAEAARRLRSMIGSTPPAIKGATVPELDVSVLLGAWAGWTAGVQLEGEALAQHMEDGALAVHAALEEAQSCAAKLLADREDAWRPIAMRLAQWLPGATRMQQELEPVKQLEAAEKWVRETTEAMRNERFAPIKEKVKHIWDLLKTRSNVSLDNVTFSGRSTKRRIDLAVTVDGTAGAALGVMSQGELHSLALALFLPRATLPASPFRFLIIDDPVQSMDPARVDGLAQVLDEVARDRQVIVFTHDDRLPDAVRRMGLPASVIEVLRREGSMVELRQVRSPRQQYLEDAYVLASTPELPPAAIRRTVPGLCRQGLEAACVDVVRRRRLKAGETHEAIETLLADNPKLMPRLAFALFDDPGRGSDVYKTLNNRFGHSSTDLVRACNEGSHHGLLDEDAKRFVRDIGKLTEGLEALT